MVETRHKSQTKGYFIDVLKKLFSEKIGEIPKNIKIEDIVKMLDSNAYYSRSQFAGMLAIQGKYPITNTGVAKVIEEHNLSETVDKTSKQFCYKIKGEKIIAFLTK